MSFLRKFSDNLASTVSTFAQRVNLDNLVEEEEGARTLAGAPATGAGDPAALEPPALPPQFSHLGFTYITHNIIGEKQYVAAVCAVRYWFHPRWPAQ